MTSVITHIPRRNRWCELIVSLAIVCAVVTRASEVFGEGLNMRWWYRRIRRWHVWCVLVRMRRPHVVRTYRGLIHTGNDSGTAWGTDTSSRKRIWEPTSASSKPVNVRCTCNCISVTTETRSCILYRNPKNIRAIRCTHFCSFFNNDCMPNSDLSQSAFGFT